jgi:hypothetical protein
VIIVVFQSRCLLEPLDGTDEWEYGEDFYFSVNGKKYVIRAGTTTDLDSVPRLPLIYWIAKNRARKAAGIHDHLYRMQEGKDYSDEVFYAAMLTEKVRQPYRALIYWAVKLFGRRAYERYAEECSKP